MSQRLEERQRRRGRAKVEPLGSSPDYRWNAVPSADRVSVVSDEVSWEDPSGSAATGSGPTRQAAARLAITVQVTQVLPATRVWLDLYAFDADGGLVSFDTHDLQHSGPTAGKAGAAELFVLDAPVWDAPATSPASAPRKLKYRVYVRPEAGLFTDGLLHDLTLPELRGRRTRKRVPQMAPRSQEAQA